MQFLSGSGHLILVTSSSEVDECTELTFSGCILRYASVPPHKLKGDPLFVAFSSNRCVCVTLRCLQRSAVICWLLITVTRHHRSGMGNSLVFCCYWNTIYFFHRLMKVSHYVQTAWELQKGRPIIKISILCRLDKILWRSVSSFTHPWNSCTSLPASVPHVDVTASSNIMRQSSGGTWIHLEDICHHWLVLL
jgi:hypothetical protein